MMQPVKDASHPLWAGQGLRLARRLPASELIARLARETMETLERLSRSGAKTR